MKLRSVLSSEDLELISEIRSQHLTFLSDTELDLLAATCREIENIQLPGIYIEAGCGLGGSAILIASVKSSQRSLNIYDVFGMIPPPSDQDTPEVHDRYKTIIEGKSSGIGGNRYYGYETNLYEIVLSNMKSFGIEPESDSVFLIKGLVQDTLKIEQPVAFAHIDVDWYEPVQTCLNRIFPFLVEGGSIIIDDYSKWGGCRKATDEFLATIPGQFRSDASAGSLKVTKLKT